MYKVKNPYVVTYFIHRIFLIFTFLMTILVASYPILVFFTLHLTSYVSLSGLYVAFTLPTLSAFTKSAITAAL